MILKRFYDESLAHASYLLGCAATCQALIVDPNRDLEQYIAAAESEGLGIAHVTETHIHADFASGSRELAEMTGAALYLSDEGDSDWKYAFAANSAATLVRDGDSFMVGRIRVTAVHTPGHTPEHLAFLVTDTTVTDEPMGVFSGDFVFVGDVGRPDLLERAAKVAGVMEPSARQLFRSLQKFKLCPDRLQIWPAHGAGSACGKSLGGVPQSTVGYERIANWAFQIEDEDAFVQSVLAGQPDPPAYFAVMKQMNKLGPPRRKPAEDSEVLSLSDVDSSVEGWVIDTRPAEEFARAFIPGTVNIPLNRTFTNWAGSLLPYDKPFTVLVADRYERDSAHRYLTLIGLEQHARYVTGDSVSAWRDAGREMDSVESVTAAEADSAECVILDVRSDSEWEHSRIPGAVQIPLGSLASRVGEIPRNRPIVVTCQSGTRSPIAASILRARGFGHVVNLCGGLDAWVESGGRIESRKLTR